MQSLSVRYRPKTFDDCVGQSATIKVLSQQIKQNQLKHAYLFCGSSGCGKTTIARIFADEVNEHVGMPIEIDAASNSGVDNVRELIKQAQERSLSSKYKIYIVDECHALSNAAWQAFLKCIEETPDYTIFIFCTTDPQKIPATVINRCMRFNFTRISSEMIKDRLDYICKHENIVDSENVTDYISKICKGQMRDGIAYLEQVADYGNPLTMSNAYAVLGRTNLTDMFLLMNAMMDGKEPEVFSLIEMMYSNGINMPLFVDEFLRFTLDLTRYSLFGAITATSIPKGFEGILKGTVNIDSPDKYFLYVADKLLSLKNMLKTDPEPRSTVEVVLLEITRCQ